VLLGRVGQPPTAPGEKRGFKMWRYLTCSGGSMLVGMKVYFGSGSDATSEELENRSLRWKASRIASGSVSTQYP